MKAKLKCIKGYTDNELDRKIKVNEEIIVSRKRADELLKNPNNIVELVEYIIEEKPKEKAVKPRKKVEKRK